MTAPAACCGSCEQHKHIDALIQQRTRAYVLLAAAEAALARVEKLATTEQLTHVLTERAPTWEATFAAGVGLCIGVPDAVQVAGFAIHEALAALSPVAPAPEPLDGE